MSTTLTLESLSRDVADLASVTRDLAQAVYKQGETLEGPRTHSDEEDEATQYPVAGGPEATMTETRKNTPPMGKMPSLHEEPDGDELMPYAMDDEDEELMTSYKAFVREHGRAGLRKVLKGYADVAQDRATEEDTPFGEKDADLDGNEPQSAGDQGGQRDDETFGVGGLAPRDLSGVDATKMIAKLQARIQKLERANEPAGLAVAARAQVPGTGSTATAGRGGSQVTLTRDLQAKAKGLSYRQINKMREDVGDLPRFI